MTTCYRDDLKAAQVRVAELEAELACREQEITRLAKGQDAPRAVVGRWLGPLLALVGMVASLSLWLERHPAERRADLLDRQLEEARGEVMRAREEARAAMEALRQQAEPGPPRIEIDSPHEHPRPPRRQGDRPYSADDDDEPSGSDPWSDELSSVERGHGPSVVWADSEPPAILIVDGESYGYTPLMVRVAPGQHSLAFVHPELGITTRNVYVAAKETVRAQIRLGGPR